MVINAKTKFMKRLVATYKRALRENGQEDANARIQHLNSIEKGLVRLASMKMK